MCMPAWTGKKHNRSGQIRIRGHPEKKSPNYVFLHILNNKNNNKLVCRTAVGV